MKKIIKLICIILAVILAVGLISNIITTPDDEPNGSGGGSSVTPDQEETPVGFDLTNWHTEDHANRCDIVEPCSNCGAEYDSDSVQDLNAFCYETFAWGYADWYNCTCGSLSTVVHRSNHCFVNGVCHDCSCVCPHHSGSLDEMYIDSLPEGHPFRVNGLSTSNNEEHDYVFDGVCALCGISV